MLNYSLHIILNLYIAHDLILIFWTNFKKVSPLFPTILGRDLPKALILGDPDHTKLTNSAKSSATVSPQV